MAVGIDNLPDAVLQLIAQHIACFPERCGPAQNALTFVRRLGKGLAAQTLGLV